jgi:hypothetical protein
MFDLDDPGNGINLRNPTTRVAETQLIVATALGLFAFLTFCVLRNTWFKLYASRYNRRKGLPTLPTKSLFGWIPVVWKINENDLLNHAGLDAVVFLGFFKMAIKLLGLMAFLSISIISPVRYHYTGNYDQGGGQNGDDSHQNGTTIFRRMTSDYSITKHKKHSPAQFQPYLWMYVFFTYVFTVLTLNFLLRQTKHVVKIRQKHLGHQNSITDRTIRLSGIPPDLRNEQTLKAHIEGLNIGKVSSITICREWRQLNRLYKTRKSVLHKLEDQWASYLGPLSFSSQKQNLPLNPRLRESFRLERSPVQRPYYDDPDVTDNEEDDIDDNLLDNSTTNGDSQEDDYRSIHEYARRHAGVTLSGQPYEHIRPKVKTGLFGLIGNEVDAIDYYTNQLDVIDQEILRARGKHFPATPTAFITMESVASAQMAAQAVLDPKVHHLITRLAPAPHDIIWDNIVLSRKERLTKLYLVTIIIGILSVSLIVPVGYLATLLNPKTIRKFWPGLGDFLEKNEWARNLVSGLLPTYLFTILNFAIPFLYVWLSSKQGFISHGEEELSAVSKNFFYIFVNLFLVFTTAGTASNYWGFLSDTTKLAYQLAQSLNELSLFYVDLIILQGIGMFPFKLLLIGSVLRFPFFKAGCKTPRDFRELYKPPVLNFGLHLPQPILILIITIIYSVFFSKILLSGLAYFIIGYFVYKYQLMYSVVHPPHSTGQVWPIVFRRIVVGLLLFQLTVAGSLAAYQNGYILAMVLIPLPFITLMVLWNFQKHYIPLSSFIALRAIKEGDHDPSELDLEDVIGNGALTINDGDAEAGQDSDVPGKSKTLDEIREKGQSYEYPYLIEPLDGPWISIEGDEVVVANGEGTVRKKVNLMEWE